ncbi:MAG TPA: N-methyl-L-tryptophan oxidase [Longimicrobiales bacterium]
MSRPSSYDVIVVGLGAMGSAAAYRLARRGVRVLGLDRWSPPHTHGSSHGRSRIIREAYFEHPLYVPLVQRAYACWAEIEALSGRRIYRRTGGLMLGAPDGAVVAGARRSALEHGLPFEELSADEVRRRFPAWRPPEDAVGIFEPRAGMLDPEAAIEAHLGLARREGAVLRFDEPVVSWTAAGDGVEATTPRGTYRAARLVLAVGAWTPGLLPGLDLPLAVERNVVCWFDPPRRTAGEASRPGMDAAAARATGLAPHAAHLFAPERFPVFIHELTPGLAWYGFPDTGDGVKAAIHHGGEVVEPEAVRRRVTDDDVARIRTLLRAHLPAADGPLREATVCLYTNAPDDHFLIDRHPEHAAVVIASPCSGHGFKFAAAIGEVIAELALDGRSRFDLSPFRIERLRR